MFGFLRMVLVAVLACAMLAVSAVPADAGCWFPGKRLIRRIHQNRVERGVAIFGNKHAATMPAGNCNGPMCLKPAEPAAPVVPAASPAPPPDVSGSDAGPLEPAKLVTVPRPPAESASEPAPPPR